MPFSTPINRRYPNSAFVTAPLHRWYLNESASPNANFGSAASGLTVSNAGAVGGGSTTYKLRATIDYGVRFFASATTDRNVIYTANPVSGDIVTGTACTVMAWIQWMRTTTDQTHAFGKVYNSTLSAFANPNYQTWGIGINSSSQIAAAFTCGTDGAGTRVAANTGQTVSVGAWYHVAGVLDNVSSLVKIYVNGAFAGSAAQSGNIDNNTAAHSNSGGPFSFGGHPSTNSGANGFQGSSVIEDAMIFNYVVTEQQIREYFMFSQGMFKGAT